MAIWGQDIPAIAALILIIAVLINPSLMEAQYQIAEMSLRLGV